MVANLVNMDIYFYRQYQLVELLSTVSLVCHSALTDTHPLETRLGIFAILNGIENIRKKEKKYSAEEDSLDILFY